MMIRIVQIWNFRITLTVFQSARARPEGGWASPFVCGFWIVRRLIEEKWLFSQPNCITWSELTCVRIIGQVRVFWRVEWWRLCIQSDFFRGFRRWSHVLEFVPKLPSSSLSEKSDRRPWMVVWPLTSRMRALTGMKLFVCIPELLCYQRNQSYIVLFFRQTGREAVKKMNGVLWYSFISVC